MMKRVAFILAIFLSGLFVSPARAEIRASVAMIEISPPIGSPMAGYSARVGNAESVHDPLTARLLYLETEETSLALVTLDLRRIASVRLIEGIKALGVDHVVAASSHTHSGPDADRDDFPSAEDSWLRETERGVIEMVREAKGDLFAARISAGKGETHLGHNRRLIGADGRATMMWRNEERKPTHPVDPTVGVIRIDDDEGNTRAVLVHYACHAVVLGPDNLAISADYPGAMRRALGEKIAGEGGDEPLVFFLQGAAGDINPYQDKQPIDDGAFEEVDRVGAQLAEAAFVAWGRLGQTEAWPEGFTVAEKGFVFEDRWEREKKVEANLLNVVFEDKLAFVAMPGEPFIDFQLALSARSPIDASFLLGYAVSGAHAWPGYIPTLEAAMSGGYGAGYNTNIEVGAGEMMLDRAVIEIYDALGMIDAVEAK